MGGRDPGEAAARILAAATAVLHQPQHASPARPAKPARKAGQRGAVMESRRRQHLLAQQRAALPPRAATRWVEPVNGLARERRGRPPRGAAGKEDGVPTQFVASTARSERVRVAQRQRDLAALAEHAAAAARAAGEAARRGQQKEVLRRAAREVGGRWRAQLEVRRSTSHQ